MTLATIRSRALSGMSAPAVRVEVHLANGLPSFTILGLPDTEVRESKDRVRAALQNSRFEHRITVQALWHWWGVAATHALVKSASPMKVFCFWMSCPSLSANGFNNGPLFVMGEAAPTVCEPLGFGNHCAMGAE